MEQDIFSDEEEVQAVETVETPEEPGVVDDGQPRDDKGRFAPKGEEQSGSPPPVKEEPAFDHAAVIAERRRRQEAEERARTLEQQLQALQQPQAAPPSIWEDDEGALAYVKNEAVSQAVQQATLNAKLDMSEMMVRQANPDFDEVKAEFLALANDNPALVQQALADPHPWNKAYQIAKNARTMRELGATDLETLRAKIREEELAKLQAQAPVAAPPALPNSLADAPAGRGGVANSGPAPFSLADIIGR